MQDRKRQDEQDDEPTKTLDPNIVYLAENIQG